ncbi:uncharacterized protein LOC125029178 [Penaeus chinensis]|uniref:uncharacterized protein LOC125029178 n=1 Tax=Penaeus chinensis TaxID=139456 RepID=UPI001FB6F4F8|nr:uncharacterized protein LOC125029178 [Penaeus chinensis]
MSMSVRTMLAVSLGVLVLLALAQPAPAITIHPAVLKNFVGPYRKPGEPVLRGPFFDRSRVVRQRLMKPVSILARRPEAEVSPQEIFLGAVETPAQPEEWNRSLRSCADTGSCAQNVDNTLNYLMRMMETGRR